MVRNRWLRFVLVVLASAAIWLMPAQAATGPAEENPRLETSASPYLQSHSRDRVRWYVWGDEAFARARERNLPLLVSFGYRACHWCHVMQEKHFNDPAIAEHINRHYVPVIVDRERRTTLDETYMLVTEWLTQAIAATSVRADNTLGARITHEKGEDLIITPEWSRRPIHILDLACRSAESGKTIKAKYK